MSLSVKYSGRSLYFPPVQSSFELSLGKASSDAGGRDTFLTTSLYQVSSVTDFCQHTLPVCSAYYITEQSVRECLPLKKKKLDQSICRETGQFCIHLVSPNYSTCISYNFFLFLSEVFIQVSTHILLHTRYKKKLKVKTI